MKIYCEKCKKDITTNINERFDKNIIGNVICPNCMHKQSRYLSGADLLIYLTSIEIIFWIISLIIFFIYNYVEISFTLIPIFIIILFLLILFTNMIKNNIYLKGLFKKIPINIEFNEDVEKIKKSYRTQFIIFLACIIICITKKEGFWLFWLLSSLAISFNVIKTILAINKEKTDYKKLYK